MIELSRRAERQLEAFVDFYTIKRRPEAILALIRSLDQVRVRIEDEPSAGLLAPRPYPILAREGRRWLKQGRYWFQYSLTAPPVILGVHFDTADIPRRV